METAQAVLSTASSTTTALDDSVAPLLQLFPVSKPFPASLAIFCELLAVGAQSCFLALLTDHPLLYKTELHI